MKKTKAPGITLFINLVSVIMLLGGIAVLFISKSSATPALISISAAIILMALAQIIYQLQVLIDKG